MRVRGRYAGRYADFAGREPALPRTQSEAVSVDGYSLLDIANAQFRNVRVSCWPSPEGAERMDGWRRWGKLGATDVTAAIIPFRTKAVGVSPAVRLNNFELEVFLCAPENQTAGPVTFPDPCCREQQCATHSDVWLLELPAPRDVHRPAVPMLQGDDAEPKPWRFRSEVVSSCDGRARAAQWIWDANGHEPVDLHGGLILRHSGDPFILACRARGKASIEIPDSRLRVRIQFSNEQYEPKCFKITPQESGEDLMPDVRQFESVMQKLNTGLSAYANTLSTSELHRSEGHNFGDPSVHDGNVIMGNVLGNVFYGPYAPRTELDT